MRDENPTVKVHLGGTKKDKVKLGEALKLMHFQVSPYIFFPLFSAHPAFLIAP
jgi:hypothetical protein